MRWHWWWLLTLPASVGIGMGLGYLGVPIALIAVICGLFSGGIVWCSLRLYVGRGR